MAMRKPYYYEKCCDGLFLVEVEKKGCGRGIYTARTSLEAATTFCLAKNPQYQRRV